MDILTVPTTTEIIKMLRQESVVIDEYLENQCYLADATSIDAISEDGILTQCYILLIEELQDQGIYISGDIDELLSSWYEAERIYHLYCWADPAHQIKLCKAHTDIIQILENILNNSVDSDILTDWFVAIEESTTQDRHKNYILNILPLIYTDNKYRKIMRKIYSQVVHVLEDFSQPVEVITSYIQEIASGRANAEAALTILRTNGILMDLTELQLKIVEKSVKYYDMAKLATDTISDYAWTSTISDPDQLSESLRAKYDQLEYDHHTTTEHHIEYYLANKNIPVDKVACILLAIGCYDPDHSQMKQDAEQILITGGDLFVDTTRQSFIQYINYFLRTRSVTHDS